MKNLARRIVLLCMLCMLLVGVSSPVFANQKINLNQASVEQLVTLKGIGEKTALKIIEYRKAHGKFSSVDEIVNVKGIGEKTLEELRASLTVNQKNN